MSDEMYTIKAKPVTYKGHKLRSQLECQTARALDQIGVEWKFEPTRFADETATFWPDFYLPEIEVLGADEFTISPLYVETRPTMVDPAFLRKAERNAATLAVSEDTPLIFVGLKEFAPAALLGWCWGAQRDRVLGVIGLRRQLTLEGNQGLPRPCLYLGEYANAWVDGWFAQRDEAA